MCLARRAPATGLAGGAWVLPSVFGMSADVQEVRLITVSREFGAGGSEFAAGLGARLGWPVLDRDVVHRVAERLRLDDGTVEHFDEHTPSLLSRIATVLIIPQPDLYAVPVGSDLPSHDRIAQATRMVIEDAARSVPLIVVGHGAQCIFSARPDALHVRMVAPEHVRLSRVAARMHVDLPAAAMLIQRADHDRQAYMQRYFHRDWRSDLLYHLQINTGPVGIDEAVTIVAGVVHGRASAGGVLESQQFGSR
jgi:CMP/dCMP kinase